MSQEEIRENRGEFFNCCNRIIKGRPFGVGCHRCARPPTKGAPSMIGEKYIGLDVHQATISVAVMDPRGKVVMESILETKASTILEFFAGLAELCRSPSKKEP